MPPTGSQHHRKVTQFPALFRRPGAFLLWLQHLEQVRYAKKVTNDTAILLAGLTIGEYDTKHLEGQRFTVLQVPQVPTIRLHVYTS